MPILRHLPLAACAGLLALLAALPRAAAKGEGAEASAAIPVPQSQGPIYTAADRERRLAEKGMVAGSPVLVRIFKAESEFELWLLKDGRYELFATYPICFWSGTLGPKQREGDRQAPEGLYTVGAAQLHLKGRHPRSLNLGFPNAFDRALARTGSFILVHGGCKSIGCFAMTDPVMEEIYALSEAALRNGQDRIQVHAFPFRLTEANLAVRTDSVWHAFWLNLKEAYDAFERTRLAPHLGVCGTRYLVSAAEPAADGIAPGPSPVLLAAEGCDSGVEVPAMESAQADAPKATVAARHRWRRHARRRSARAAYAAARRARVAAHARRLRTTSLGGKRAR
jgi:murein L,D-transpeptidase YafK